MNSVNTVKSATAIVAKMAAQMLADELQFVKTLDKEDASTYGEAFKSVQPGDTIYVSKPARFTVRTNATFSAQSVTEEKVALVVDQRSGCDVSLTSLEIATDLALKSWAKRVLKPAVSRIAQDVEQRVIQSATQACPLLVGTPGTAPNSALIYLQAGQKLDEHLCPLGDRKVLINPAANTATVDALKGLFQSSTEIAKQYRDGYMGTGLGFDFLRNNLVWSLTTGTQAGAANALSNGATQSGATIAIDTMTGSATIKKGTIVTFAGVNDVHPITKADLGYLKQFTITADVTLSGGAGNLSISPSLDASATSTQNATSTVADESAVTFSTGTAASTTYAQNLAYHPSAVRFVSVPLFEPKGVHEASTQTVNGISIRAIEAYDYTTDTLNLRLDTQFGSAVVRETWMCRLTG